MLVSYRSFLMIQLFGLRGAFNSTAVSHTLWPAAHTLDGGHGLLYSDPMLSMHGTSDRSTECDHKRNALPVKQVRCSALCRMQCVLA